MSANAAFALGFAAGVWLAVGAYVLTRLVLRLMDKS